MKRKTQPCEAVQKAIESSGAFFVQRSAEALLDRAQKEKALRRHKGPIPVITVERTK